ncbi:MAG TPA: hypothetical protein DEP69_07165, partial [Acidimicrobiaceae bacterium]|nr:hypothetical protein [Acidimicrobiaceae bacterium]
MSEPARSTARSGPARSGEALPSVTANLTWLRPGAVGGSENYVLSILAALAECAPQLDLRVVASSATLDAHSWLRERFAVRAVRLPGGRAGRFAREWALFQRRGLLRRRRGAVEPPAGVTHHLGGYEGGRLRARGSRRR